MTPEEIQNEILKYMDDKQFDISPIPAHTHNGTDSLLIDFTNLQNVTKSSYTQKGVVEFLTSATVSGITVASGIANVNMGTGANQIVQLDSGAKLPAVDGSQLTNLPLPLGTTIATVFETLTRFTRTITDSGAGALNTNGYLMSTGAGVNGSSDLKMTVNNLAGNLYLGSPIFSASLQYTDPGIAAGCTSFVGLGSLTVATAGITFTGKHIGFKTINYNIYATQGDGTTETVSSAIASTATTDIFDFIFKVNGTTSVSYYYRQNGGALTLGATLTTNIPSGTTIGMQFSTSSNSTVNGLTLQLYGANYQR